MFKKINWLNSFLAGSLIIGILLWFGKGIWNRVKPIEIVMLPTPECDLRTGPCKTSLPTGESIELNSLPTNLPALTPVLLQVKTANLDVRAIQVDFKGKEMPMGEYHYVLTPQGNHTYTARSMLPTCKNPEMAWLVSVVVDAGHKKYCAPFILVNERPVGGWRVKPS